FCQPFACTFLFYKHYFKTIYIFHYNQSIEFNAKVFVLLRTKEYLLKKSFQLTNSSDFGGRSSRNAAGFRE
ncbi:MAG: hypothetical protein K1V92_11720, partial [Bacteroides acidifaciens]